MEQEPDWGLIFFAHEGINCKDHFQATRTELAKKVQYDPFITVYISDCDYYPRVMADGYKLVSYTDFCPGLNLKVGKTSQNLPDLLLAALSLPGITQDL